MTVRYGSDRESDNSKFIEDVVVPVGKTGFNVRHGKVRRQSIGRLEQEYLRNRAAISHAPAETDSGSGSSAVVVRPKPSILQYTHIPPMPVLHPDEYDDGTSRVVFAEFMDSFKRFVRSSWRRVAAVGAAALAFAGAAPGHLKHFHMDWLPKRYSAARGQYTDWHTKTFSRLKWVTPLFLLMIGLLAFVVFTPLPNRGSGAGQARRPAGGKGGSAAATTPGVKPASSKTSAAGKTASAGSSGSLVSPSGTSGGAGSSGTGTGIPSTAPINGTTYLVGGMGGGGPLPSSGAPAPTTSTSSSTPTTITSPVATPSVPTTTTVTVPPLQVQSGGKQLLDTSGLSGTLN